MKIFYISFSSIILLISCQGFNMNENRLTNEDRFLYRSFSIFDLSLLGKIDKNSSSITYPFVEVLNDSDKVNDILMVHVNENRVDTIKFQSNNFCKYHIRSSEYFKDFEENEGKEVRFTELTLYHDNSREVFMFKNIKGDENLYLEQYSKENKDHNTIANFVYNFKNIIKNIDLKKINQKTYNYLIDDVKNNSNICWQLTYYFNNEETIVHRIHFYPFPKGDKVFYNEKRKVDLHINDYFWTDYFFLKDLNP